MFGGEPFGCLVGDYYFDNSPSDVALLRQHGQGRGRGAHAVHRRRRADAVQHGELAGADEPARSHQDRHARRTTPSWNSLRKSEDSRYIGLTMPRVLARLPYGAKTKPVEAFDFEEDDRRQRPPQVLLDERRLRHGASTSTARSSCTAGARASAASNRAVRSTNLPVHTFPTDDGGVAMKCPTEIAIDDRREAELAKLGLMPILHRKNTDIAAFIGAQSLQKPEEYDDPDATANANLSARLPYLFAVCRFAHYLKSIARDKIGSFKEREDMQKWLQRLDHRTTSTAIPEHLVRGGQGAEAAARGRGRGRGGRGQPGLLQRTLLPAAALPARRPDGFACGWSPSCRRKSSSKRRPISKGDDHGSRIFLKIRRPQG